MIISTIQSPLSYRRLFNSNFFETNPLPYLAEQLDNMNASTEDSDSDLKDMLGTLLQHL